MVATSNTAGAVITLAEMPCVPWSMLYIMGASVRSGDRDYDPQFSSGLQRALPGATDVLGVCGAFRDLNERDSPAHQRFHEESPEALSTWRYGAVGQ